MTDRDIIRTCMHTRDLHWKNAAALPQLFTGKTASVGIICVGSSSKSNENGRKPAAAVSILVRTWQ